MAAQVSRLCREIEFTLEVERVTRTYAVAFKLQIADRVGAACLRVAVGDVSVADHDTAEFDFRGILEFRFGDLDRRNTARVRKVVPVGAAVGSHREIDDQAFNRRGTDSGFAAQDQRQEANAQAGLVETHERLVTKSFGITELGAADLDREPRKQAQGQIAFDGQVAPGGILDGSGNLVAVLIGVEEQEERNGHQHDKANHAGNDDQECSYQVVHRVFSVGGSNSNAQGSRISKQCFQYCDFCTQKNATWSAPQRPCHQRDVQESPT